MSHLAEYSSVGRRNAFDGIHTSVGIIRALHSWSTVESDILSCNLSVYSHFFELGGRSNYFAQGLRLDATLMFTIVETWREMLLNVSVGDCSVNGATRP